MMNLKKLIIKIVIYIKCIRCIYIILIECKIDYLIVRSFIVSFFIQKKEVETISISLISTYLFNFSLIAACAAAKRAIGTLNGEQDT